MQEPFFSFLIFKLLDTLEKKSQMCLFSRVLSTLPLKSVELSWKKSKIIVNNDSIAAYRYEFINW